MPRSLQNYELQRSLGADTVMLSPDDLNHRLPHMSTKGIAAASFGQSGEGWFDPYQLMTLIRKAALAKDVTFITAAITAIDVTTGVSAVTLSTGQRLTLSHFVNATGTQAGEVAMLAGIDLPVSAAKRYVYVVDCPGAPEALRKGPLSFDINGFYFRPEGHNFLWGYTPTPAEEPEIKDWEIDYDLFENKLWEMAAARVPVFETVKLVSSWVGHYDYNWFDQNGVIGRHPEITNFYFANGYSGHGIQQGPASGNAVAELICFGEYRTIDLAALGYQRLHDNQPLYEKNIY